MKIQIERIEKYKSSDIVKSCPKLERGLRFGPEGIRACQVGPFASPIYWTEEEASNTTISKEMIVNKRKEIFLMLNDNYSQTDCKRCSMVVEKEFKDVVFTQLGHIDHAPRTICNLRCDYCGYTHAEARGDLKNGFIESNYDSLEILKLFDKADVKWDSFVDFNGGEPSLLKNINDYLSFFNEIGTRALIYTNSIIYHQSIYDGLINGNISWVVTSIDAGTAETYKKTKKADVYNKVIQNSIKYAQAGRKGDGNFAVKYIFTNHNCGLDDLEGFVDAMLKVKPNRIWLTFDFEPFGIESENLSKHDQSEVDQKTSAYAKLFLMLRHKKLDPIHYSIGHLARISNAGKEIMNLAMEKIKTLEDAELITINVKTNVISMEDGLKKLPHLQVIDNKFYIFQDEKRKEIDLYSKKIIVGPAWYASVNFSERLKKSGANLIGFADKSKFIQGKKIGSEEIYSYEKLIELKPDYLIILPPISHRKELLEYSKQINAGQTKIIIYDEDNK